MIYFMYFILCILFLFLFIFFISILFYFFIILFDAYSLRPFDDIAQSQTVEKLDFLLWYVE
jgi:hypothetical protein